jgi:NAD(P)-dependent dehydrogenase (short-subunit alcohol dehydrogenase family)
MTEREPSKRVALVTGATGAIGKAIAAGLARRNFKVVIVARDRLKGERTATGIGGDSVSVEIADLSSRREIFALAERWQGPLHVLVNNAAECPRRRQETEDGIERQFATNVLGYFWMMTAFQSVLEASAPARVVNVASYWAGGLDLDDLELKRRRYDNDDAYRQSKQADRMLSAAFAERLKGTGVTVSSCHPGDVRSKLSSDLGFGGHETPEQGAATPIWVATAPELEGVTGRYFAHQSEERCRFSADKEAVQRLFEVCEGYR